MQSLMATFALLLVLEGLLPFLVPAQWRETVMKVARFRDGQIRFVGLGAIVLGLFLMWMTR